MSDKSREDDKKIGDDILRLGREFPLPEDESKRLLTAVVNAVVRGLTQRGDTAALASLPKSPAEVEVMVNQIVELRVKP